jgi:hypothetical protein
MSSVIRYTRESTPLSSRFTVWPYYGAPSGGTEYYFTVQGTSLYRIEADLSGTGQWVVARDMGKETFINTIDIELIEWWETQNAWSDITVIRRGRARKYQLLAIPNGSTGGADNNGPAWNAAAYTDPTADIINCPIYDNQNTGINDLLITGNATTTINNNYNQNLPFGTFWAVIDPVVIRYTSGGSTYTRAIVNRVTPS